MSMEFHAKHCVSCLSFAYWKFKQIASSDMMILVRMIWVICQHFAIELNDLANFMGSQSNRVLKYAIDNC